MPTVAGVIASQGKSIVRDSMTLFYDFSLSQCYPGSGTTVTDLSGGSNNGTLQATPTFTNTGHFSFVGASSQYISTATSFTNPGPYTVAVWFRTSTASGRNMINFENTQTGTTATGYDRMLNMGTTGVVRFGNYDGTTDVAVSPTTLNNGAWHYAVGTYGGESTTMRLYIDGASVATATSTTTQSYTGWWRIAGYKAASWPTGMGDGYYTGDIGAVMVYSKGLTAAEVSQNFEAMRGRFNV